MSRPQLRPDGYADLAELVRRVATLERTIRAFLPISGPPATAPPTSGTHVVGEIVLNSAPTASGYIGWTCVTAGSPGVWKTWGAISA